MSKDFKVGIKNTITASASDNVCELYFLDAIANPTYYDWNSGEEVEGSLLENIISQVKYSQASKIVCYIDSLGGSFGTGLAIYNYLKNCSVRVECKILSMCGSIATIIACAANSGKVSMPKSGLYIIHEASENPQGGSYRSSDLMAMAASTDKCTDVMCGVYEQKTKMTKDELKALIAPGDYWMTGEEALAKGFVDSLYNDEAVTVSACIKTAQSANIKVPDNILALDNSETEESTADQNFLKQQFMELKSFVTAAIDAIKGKKVDTKAENITAQIGDAIAEPLAQMVTSIQEQVTAEITGIEEKVTAALEAKYSAEIAELKSANTKLREDITAYLTKMAGKEAPAMGKEDAIPTGPSLAGGRKSSVAAS